jgi:hypothetical protein
VLVPRHPTPLDEQNSRTLRQSSVFLKRSQSTTSNHAFINAKRNMKVDFYKKNWFSDPSAYPLFVAMGAALALVSGVMGSCILYNPDVQINPAIRGSIIRPKQE